MAMMFKFSEGDRVDSSTAIVHSERQLLGEIPDAEAGEGNVARVGMNYDPRDPLVTERPPPLMTCRPKLGRYQGQVLHTSEGSFFDATSS